jgi:L-methionine (R)-S-oxide reductase
MIDPKRPARYGRIHTQLESLLTESPNLAAAMATVSALLHAKLRHHSWTGFYLLAGMDEMHVGPYQGPVACQVLRGGGVCLHAARTVQAVVVADVHQFPGHIACDARARSEIVIPLARGEQVVAVLDLDSHAPAQWDEDDIAPLQGIVDLLQRFL